MIGYFGDIIFETSDKKICNFNDFKQAASANYSEHSRYRKKSEREFIGPNNEGVSFTMKIRAGHGVRPIGAVQPDGDPTDLDRLWVDHRERVVR